jgi:hypothetical protein
LSKNQSIHLAKLIGLFPLEHGTGLQYVCNHRTGIISQFRFQHGRFLKNPSTHGAILLLHRMRNHIRTKINAKLQGNKETAAVVPLAMMFTSW